MKNLIRQKLKRIRMELNVLNSDLNELEDSGCSSKHLLSAMYYVKLMINELSSENFKNES